ncbi:MAG TPA: glycosyltransferase family 4 protein [Acidimicrobiales bacterium]|nr:glycosyltransferase family 4 protein [Acidimicrobiales bacterium]
MNTGAVHQFVPALERGAVGGHLLEVRHLARELGLRSEAFAEHVRPEMASVGHSFTDYGGRVPARPDDVLLYHSAIGSSVADFVLQRPERLAVDYHNITPERFFSAWEPSVTYGLSWGRSQLASLAARAELGIADSAHNESELRALRYRRTTVVPILLDLETFDVEADPRTLEELSDGGGAAWLFVGRVAPNKCHHDIIKAFAVHRRTYDPAATLRLVGASSSDTYVESLRDYVAALQLDDAVLITGAVSPAELSAHYRAADVFVCLSEHEGFCVPLLEAMHHGLPIVAYASTAVPETLGGAGLCLEAKGAELVAAAVDRVVRDGELRCGLVAAGRARLADFDLRVTRARMTAALESLVGA